MQWLRLAAQLAFILGMMLCAMANDAQARVRVDSMQCTVYRLHDAVYRVKCPRLGVIPTRIYFDGASALDFSVRSVMPKKLAKSGK